MIFALIQGCGVIKQAKELMSACSMSARRGFAQQNLSSVNKVKDVFRMCKNENGTAILQSKIPFCNGMAIVQTGSK